jgi:hypothetical protein
MAAVAWRVRVRIDETAGSRCGAGKRWLKTDPGTAVGEHGRFRFGLTLLGTALVVRSFTNPISWATLVTVLLSWLCIYVAVRIGARAAEKMIFPGER